MTVRKHALKSFKHMSAPVSYKLLDEKNLYDARNVFDNKGITETRYGIARYNTTSLGGEILSLSYFRLSSGTSYLLAKVGTVLYSVIASGAATVVKTGLSATTKHRAVTLNDRHIIVIEGDGMFSYNGTIFTALGQAAPSVPTVAAAAGGSLTSGNYYQVGITYYSSSTGFESNASESVSVQVSGGNLSISVTNIPTTATNATIDKVRVYLKNNGTSSVGSANDYLYTGHELDIGDSTDSITLPTFSTITPPTTHAPPLSGGAKYIALFGKKIAVAGNATFKSEVFVSEEYLPDAWDDNPESQTIIQASGQGPITGLGVGLFNDAVLSPFLAIFKKNSTTVYSEISSIPELNTIDAHVGCISHDTIRVRNGAIVFMGSDGWYIMVNGNVVKDSKGIPARLGDGTIDDIFSRRGWSSELNISNASNFFSAYYPSDAHYVTFVSEGSSSIIQKAYVYEERINGFRVWDFNSQLVCATEGEDDSGYQCIFIGDKTGTIFTYYNRNSRHDEDYAGNSQIIQAYVILPYIMPGDDACSYNFRTLAVRAIGSENAVTVDVYPSFSLTSYDSLEYDFPNTGTGFILDVSQLDVDALGDERTPVTFVADLNRTGEALLIKFSQSILDANIGLISAQLSLNKNGSRNL